jgi:hypothetical protein
VSAEARRRFARTLIAAAAPILVVSVLVIPGGASAATIVRVPEDFSTIQAAVDAASDGDVIDIAPGTYAENVTIAKPLTLRGRVYDTMDPRRNATILDGGGLSVLTIPAGVSPGPRLIGLAIENGDDGVAAESPFKIEHSFLLGNQDALDYGPGAGGLCTNNVFVRSADDALDFDHLVNDVRVEGNRMLHTGDDGIEIRLHDDVIPETAELLVRDNEIAGSAEDGIQIIDYLQKTNRRIVVRGNLIRNTAMAGIGLMSDGNTKEDFSAASVRERVHVFGNTFVDNDHGISGGNNLIALNNIFQGQGLALKDVDATSIASYNLFWNNGINARHSDVDRASSIHADPLLDADFHPGAGSQAVDAGAAHFEWRGEVVLDRQATSYQGTAPDLGWYERRQ